MEGFERKINGLMLMVKSGMVYSYFEEKEVLLLELCVWGL